MNVLENFLLFIIYHLLYILFILFRSDIILNVEYFADFIQGFALDHIGNCFASQFQQRFDIKVIGSLCIFVEWKIEK